MRSLGGLTVGFPRAPVPDVDTMWAEVPVAVTDHDVADVPVMLTQGRPPERTDRVRGRRRATSPGDAPIMLMRTDGREYGDMPFGVSEPDGTFRTVGVPPGPYALVALAATHRLRTLAHGSRCCWTSRNVFDSAFDVGTADIQDVVVTVRLRMCTLSGNVRDGVGRVAS